MRPVSLTLTTCKLAERMALTHISHFLETEGRFHLAQTGFSPNLGTHDSLLLVKQGVLRGKTVGRGNRHPSIIVAVDLQKAFDTMTHEAIIEAAERQGITGRPLNFVRSFRQDRTFSVRVDGDVGKVYPNMMGVPQGSILSPLLVNLIMIGLAQRLEAISELGFTIHVENITLWTASRPIHNQQETLQAALDVIDHYLPQSGMRPSPEKTTYAVIRGSAHDEATFTLTLGGETLQRSEKPARVRGIPIEHTGTVDAWLADLRQT